MHIRQARPGDELAVATVHVRTWQVAYRGLLPDALLDGMRPEHRAARYTFADQGTGRPQTFLAHDGDQLRGLAAFGPTRDRDVDGLGEIRCAVLRPLIYPA